MTQSIFTQQKKDLCNIFMAVEREFDIKYCADYVYAEAESEEKPDIAFSTIEEIADSCGMVYYIVQKTQVMKTVRQVLQDEGRVRYITRCDAYDCLTLRAKAKNPNGYEGDYGVHIPRR